MPLTRLPFAALAVGLALATTAAQAQQARTAAQQTAKPAAQKPTTQKPTAQKPAAPARAPQAQAAPAQATPAPSGPRALGSFESWTAIEMVERAGKICYMVGRPSQSEPRGARRGEIMLTVSHRPGQQNQVSFHAGYPYKGGAPVVVEIERRKFEMFTRPEVDEDAAWTPDGAVDKSLVDAMRIGKSLTVKGTSARGTETTDTIPLAGFSRALTEINKACNVR